MPFTPAAPMNSRACVTPFCPTVASSTSSTSWGAPATSRDAMRRIFSSSFIRFTRVWRRPAVSTRIGSRPLALPDEIASKTTAAGSAPSRARLDGLDDAGCRRDANVGGDEHLFERLDGIDVDRPRTAFRRVGKSDQLVEAVGDLLLGARKAVAKATKDRHWATPLRLPPFGAAASVPRPPTAHRTFPPALQPSASRSATPDRKS